MKTTARQSNAFTLTELLVVLAVIAFSAATLVAAVSQTGGKGRTMRCLSNVRRLALASQMYANDHNDYLPNMAGQANAFFFGYSLMPYLGSTLSTNPAVRPTPSQLITNYYAKLSVFQCPSFPKTLPGAMLYLHYTMAIIDFDAFRSTGAYECAGWRKLSSFPGSLAAIGLIVEVGPGAVGPIWYDLWREESFTFDHRGIPNIFNYPRMIAYDDTRHMGSTIVSFADSHVEVREIDKVQLPLRLFNPLDPR